MKKKYLIFIALTALLLACTENFDDYNIDKKNPAIVAGEPLFTSAQLALADQISTPNVNLNVFRLFAQYWTETTYTDEANYDIVNRTIADFTFRAYYRDILKDLQEASKLIGEETVPASEEVVKKNKLHIIELITVYTWQNLVDIFGNVPYSAALDIENVIPVYDDAFSIYQDLITRTNAALTGLDDSEGSFGSADLIYEGDVAAWVKFGNSLKVKLGITIADHDAALAKSTIESAVGGIFESNDDNALLQYLSSTPNSNPVYDELVLTGRKDFVAANTIVDLMAELNDPRIFSYFSDPVSFRYKSINGTKQDSVINDGLKVVFIYDTYDGKADSVVQKIPPYTILAADSSRNIRYHVGGIYGESSPYALYSHVSEAILEPTFPGILMTYDEILFYLAEAAERGITVPQTAEEYYNDAITASFDFWDVLGINNYLARQDVAYSTAKGDWKEKIAAQFYISLYSRGLEGFTVWRRLDHPVFNMPPTPISDDIPTRFTYPINEQTLNPDNYKAAATAIGGDELTTKLFWDKF